MEDSSSDDGEPLASQGRLIFEYLERDLPYIREPFTDKVCLYFNSVYQVSKACVICVQVYIVYKLLKII